MVCARARAWLQAVWHSIGRDAAYDRREQRAPLRPPLASALAVPAVLLGAQRIALFAQALLAAALASASAHARNGAIRPLCGLLHATLAACPLDAAWRVARPARPRCPLGRPGQPALARRGTSGATFAARAGRARARRLSGLIAW